MKKVGVIGSGAISDIFLTNMIENFDNLEVVACTSKTMVSARKKAEQYGIRAITLDEMMNDPGIEVVVNLTPVPVHYEILKKALEHGKHVYTEKVLTQTYAQAKELCELADEKGLQLCCAPDTFLGAAVQTAKKAVEDGLIGRVSSVDISFNRDISLLAEFFRFVIDEGAGAGYDFGIYFLQAILSILGPVKEVAGIIQTNEAERTYMRPENPQRGESYTIRNENVMVGLLRFENGTLGTLNFNTDSIFPEGTNMTLYGTKGILSMPNPNNFGGEVRLHRTRTREDEVLPLAFPYEDNMRGLGVSEMVDAIEHGRRPRASKELASHALEILEGIVRSSETGRFVRLESTFEIPALMEEKK